MFVERLRGDGMNVRYLRVLLGCTAVTAFVMYCSTGERGSTLHLRHAVVSQLSPDDADTKVSGEPSSST
ncbi:MAG: hypothetical protein DRJ56_02470 [Thermoprotei archaeon]|nr:MAG: hypothetical protein DRJ56_02470 [Thermoprotei archaeon]